VRRNNQIAFMPHREIKTPGFASWVLQHLDSLSCLIGLFESLEPYLVESHSMCDQMPSSRSDTPSYHSIRPVCTSRVTAAARWLWLSSMVNGGGVRKISACRRSIQTSLRGRCMEIAHRGTWY